VSENAGTADGPSLLRDSIISYLPFICEIGALRIWKQQFFVQSEEFMQFF
jgi:hypothetical protein